MEAAYFGVHLWVQAVKEAESDDDANIRQAVRHQSFDAPEGMVRIDHETQHTSKIVRIVQITTDSSFKVVFDSRSPIAPIPFPSTKSQGEWDAFLLNLKLNLTVGQLQSDRAQVPGAESYGC